MELKKSTCYEDIKAGKTVTEAFKLKSLSVHNDYTIAMSYGIPKKVIIDTGSDFKEMFVGGSL